MKAGTRVVMRDTLKRELMGACTSEGHVDGTDDETCTRCSKAHLAEFGHCVGVVQGPTSYGATSGPEVDVRWEPSGLRYAYRPDQLQVLPTRANYSASRRCMTLCQADDDDYCEWPECPQNRDGEPARSGRHCPLDTDREEP